MGKLSKDAFAASSSDLAFRLAKEANLRKARGENVIDCTLGMLFGQDGHLANFDAVNKSLGNSLGEQSAKYGTICGGIPYANSVERWVLEKYHDSIKENYSVCTTATPGGTGALFLAIRNYLDKEQKLLLPSLGWANYESICKSVNRGYSYYNLFNGEEFDIDSFLFEVNKSVEETGRAMALINDPCHNPTGYCLSKEEWIKVIKGLEEINKKGEVILLLDIAYIDYAPSDISRVYFELINEMNVTYMTLVAFSASKTLSIYGYRCGAIMAIDKQVEVIDEFYNGMKCLSRATWSNANHFIINAFTDIMNDKERIGSLRKQIEEYQEILKERKEYALKTIVKPGDKVLPYKHGFFITIEKENAMEYATKLQEQNIFILPMKNKYLRIAICSMNITEK